jgi:hypothetical protein
MTLDAAVVDFGGLRGSFAHGQYYVAVSRVRSIDCLQIIGFNASSNGASASPVALDFYRMARPFSTPTTQKYTCAAFV